MLTIAMSGLSPEASPEVSLLLTGTGDIECKKKMFYLREHILFC
jgi:hypothetical protein